MITNVLLAVAAACLFAEFIGYWLHILMHSNKIEFLSKNHMIHHLVIYAPNKPLRPSRDYLLSTYNRANILGLGMEWIGLVLILLVLILPTLHALRVPPLEQIVFILTALAWDYAMFWYMHDGLHLRGFWMETSPWLRNWFLGVRKLHDIHHMQLDNQGKMPKNFGICFFLFDRIFGTLATEHKPFNHHGLDAATKRYAYIFPPTPKQTLERQSAKAEEEEFQDTGVVD